jgi:4-hydroxybenzoate polyprenyltransferase
VSAPKSPPLGVERLSLLPYVRIARPDHWFKNTFVLLGSLLAAFYVPGTAGWRSLAAVGATFVAASLVASSNYVLNELLDAPTDRLHPMKRGRPVPLGLVRPSIAYVEWIALAVAGVAVALTVNRYVAGWALMLWVMGLIYNVPPLRAKEWPYVDVLTEALNNVVRLGLGWFAVVVTYVPPLSLLISYWMAGAFFMATKRFAECRHIGDPDVAARYRRSFRHYTPDRLLVSMLFYALVSALFGGVFIVRYHLELILFAPLGLGLLAFYLHLGLRPNSPAQQPERLYREPAFSCYAAVTTIVFVVLMFTRVPVLYRWFNVEPATVAPLWTIGPRVGPR